METAIIKVVFYKCLIHRADRSGPGLSFGGMFLEGNGTCRECELNHSHSLSTSCGAVFLGSLRAKERSGESQ